MNVKKARKRFTELTGLPAKKISVYPAILQNKGYFQDWVSSIRKRNFAHVEQLDARHGEYWASLLSYLESLQEVK